MSNPLDTFLSYINDNSGALAGLFGGLGLYNAYDDLGDLGRDGYRYGTELADELLTQTQFRPYGITTASGSSFGMNVNPKTGELNTTMTLSPEEQAMRDSLMANATSMYDSAAQGIGERTDDIFQSMQTAMQPGMQRQRLENEQRMAAQGRLGMSSNMFGGMAPEDFKLNLAQQEAMNNAYLGAMQQARGEQAQQAAIAQQMFGASYLPQNQLIAGLQPGMTAAGQQQQANLYGAGLFGQARASGIDALLGAGMGRANIVGAASTGLLSGLFGG